MKHRLKITVKILVKVSGGVLLRTRMLAYNKLSFTITELHFILPVPVDMLRWCSSSLRAKPSLTYVTIKTDPP